MSGPHSPTITSTELGAELSGPWTAAEREVWRILEQGLLGYTFRRNVVVNGILVGFYCAELGLVLDLTNDGAVESTAAPLEAALGPLNLKIARLEASQVNRSNLVEAIERAVGRGRLWPED
jgi:very-short-patch-repair endonuclease